MKKILITGTLGFIFSNFIKKVVDQYPEYTFVGIDNATEKYRLKNANDGKKHWELKYGKIPLEIEMQNKYEIVKN